MTRCPSRCITPEVSQMLRAFAHYSAGFLPAPGGLLDQAATFVETMEFLAALKNVHEVVRDNAE